MRGQFFVYVQMLKTAKAGKPVNLEDLPPPVHVKESSAAKEAPPTQAKPRPPPTASAAAAASAKSKQPSNLIDLDDPEFDEFNLTEEELASMAAGMVDDRQQQSVTASHSSSSVTASHSGSSLGPPKPQPRSSPKSVGSATGMPSAAKPPQAKPRPQPNPPPPSLGPGGLIDLDDAAFDEFTLSEDEIAAMATLLVDDRQEPKKPKLDSTSASSVQSSQPPTASSSSSATKLPPAPQPAPRAGKQAPPPPRPAPVAAVRQAPPPAQSLPATLKKPVAASSSDKNMLVSFLNERMEQYQQAAKSQKDPNRHKEYRLIAAKFSRVVKGVESGQDIDLSQMPGPPPGYRSSYDIDPRKFSATSSASSAAQSQGSKSVAQGQSSPAASLTSQAAAGEEPDTPNPDIPVPKTALEALEQRLAKYREGLKTAQDKGESSRVRRMGRIIKQYEAAVKSTKAGKACDYADLPTPPGYPPIPAPRLPIKQTPVPLPTQSLPATATAVRANPSSSSVTPSLSQQQLALVERRLTELKRAAKIEQTNQNRDGALELMRRAKGAETMLRAAQSGLPVNMEQLPPSPFADLDATTPSSQVVSHLRPAEEKDKETFDLIIKQLERQIETCDKNAETYKKMGSSASAIEYENMSQNCQRELLALKGIQGAGFGPPKFSLEMRTLTIIHSNAHVSSGACEVEVAKVLNITRPPKYEEKDMDVYVEVEFPYPTDTPPKKSTEVVHKSSSPEFTEQAMLFEIDRKHHRSMIRAFKRTPLKCTAWQHRSLRRHIFLGEGWCVCVCGLRYPVCLSTISVCVILSVCL